MSLPETKNVESAATVETDKSEESTQKIDKNARPSNPMSDYRSQIESSQVADNPKVSQNVGDEKNTTPQHVSLDKEMKLKEMKDYHIIVQEKADKTLKQDKGKEEKTATKAGKEKKDSHVPAKLARVSKTVQLDVVELLKQVLQWTPLYKPGLNKALLQAAKVGSTGCVKVLLSAGADADTEDDQGDTPFVHAFRGLHSEVMEILRDSGCNTEIAKMSLALATKDIAFVKLCHSFDIPIENEDWNSVDPDEVRILLEELKLDPFEGQYGRHGFDDSPFMYLAQEGRPEVLEMMINLHPCINKYTEEDKQIKINKAYLKAVRHHRLDNVKVLINTLGADISAIDDMERSAFTMACGVDEAIALYLLELGADINQPDHEGLTPLHWGACAGFKDLCSKLLEKGFPVDCRAKLGATPLMVACSSRHAELGQLLIDSGADVNIATPEGWTALHVAVRACSPAMVRLLLTNNAEPNVQSSKLTHNSDVVPASTPFLISIALNSMTMIRHLLDANCDLNLSGLVFTNPSFSSSESEDDFRYQKQRCTPIQYAIISRAWDIAELLIKAGCNVGSVRLWLEYKRAPVHIPEDKSKYLRHLIYMATTTPVRLKHLCRKKIRLVMGRNLVDKVELLEIPALQQSYILFQDLFRAQSGSFEV